MGFADETTGMPLTAELWEPLGVAVDAMGAVYVADAANSRIRKLDLAGNVTTLAGNGHPGDVDGTGGPGGTAELDWPSGIVFASIWSTPALFVVDQNGQRIRKVDLAGNTSTLTGNGTGGYRDGTGGRCGTTELSAPVSITYCRGAGLYVSDLGNERVRLVDPLTGMTGTVAGNGTAGFADETKGTPLTAEFNGLWGLACAPAGNLYIGELDNDYVRKLDLEGNVTTLAGDRTPGYRDGSGGPCGNPEFWGVAGIVVDDASNVYVADRYNNVIRMIAPSGDVSTFAGNGTTGDRDGPAATAEFNQPVGLAFGPKGTLYVSEFGGNRIRAIRRAR